MKRENRTKPTGGRIVIMELNTMSLRGGTTKQSHRVQYAIEEIASFLAMTYQERVDINLVTTARLAQRIWWLAWLKLPALVQLKAEAMMTTG